MSGRRFVLGTVLLVCAVPFGARVPAPAQAPAGVVVRIGAGLAQEPLDGRLLLLMSKDGAVNRAFR